MEPKQKSLGSSIILQRAKMLGEDQIPPDIWDRFIQTSQEKMIFLTVADPDQ